MNAPDLFRSMLDRFSARQLRRSAARRLGKALHRHRPGMVPQEPIVVVPQHGFQLHLKLHRSIRRRFAGGPAWKAPHAGEAKQNEEESRERH